MKLFSSIAVPLLTVLALLPYTSAAQQSEARLENCQGRICEFDHSKFDFASDKINLNLKLNDKLPFKEFNRRLKERQLPNGNAYGYWESDDGSALNLLQTQQGKLVGSITVNGSVYDISSGKNGRVTTVERKTEEFPDEIDPIEIPTSSDFYGIDSETDPNLQKLEAINGGGTRALRGSSQENESRRLFDDSGGNLDVLVVWTKKAECANAGLTSCALNDLTTDSELLMRARIDLAVEETNTAFALSGVTTLLRLVHAYREVNYVEASTDAFLGALSAIQSTSDGNMDDVHSKRTQYGADIVAMIIDDKVYCGIGYFGPSKAYMFSATRWSCATGYYSFGHEIGHNLGLNHDRGASGACSTVGYNYGFRDPNADFRSIMAYNCVSGQCDSNAGGGGCTRVQRFSSSSNLYNGKAIGDDANDSARAINQVKATVAAYYPAVPIGPTPTSNETTTMLPLSDSNEETGYDAAILFQWRDATDVLQNHGYVLSASFLAFLFVLVFCFGQILWLLACGSNYLKARHTELKIYRMVTWTLEFLAGVNFVFLLFIYVDPALLYGDSIMPGRRTGEMDNDWNEKLGWLKVLDRFLIFYGWGALPFIAIYFLELLQLGPMMIPKMLAIHHFVVIVVLFYGANAFLSTLNGLWLQTVVYMFMHVGLEFPIWAALIAYRLKWWLAAGALYVATVYELLLRVALWFASTVTYIALCWKSHTYTPWELFWRWAFPIVMVLQIVPQVYSLRVHWQLSRKAVQATDAPPPGAIRKSFIGSDSSSKRRSFMFDQEAPLRSTDARSTDTGSRGSHSKGGKPIRRSHTPPRSKSSTESGDFLNSRKAPIDSRKAQVSNMRSGDLQQEDFERRGPHRTTTGGKPKGGDLHDLCELEQSVEKKERSSTSKTRIIEDSGHSIPNGSQASTASNEDTTAGKNEQQKPPLNSRKSHALQMSMSGDIHGEPIQRAPHRSKSAINSGDLQVIGSDPNAAVLPQTIDEHSNAVIFPQTIDKHSNAAVLPQTIDEEPAIILKDSTSSDDSSEAGKRRAGTIENEHTPSVESSSVTGTLRKLTVGAYLCFLSLFVVLFVIPSVFYIADDGYIAEVLPEQRIAIVGGGIAGLGAAWAMKVSPGSNRFRVTVMDSASWLGGAAISAYAEDDKRGTVFYEHGFAVFKDYVCFELLLESLGVEKFLSAGSVAAVYGDAENGTTNTMGPSLPRISFGNNRFTKFMPEVELLDKKLARALEEWNEHDLMTVTLDTFLASDFSDDFIYNYLSFCLGAYVAARGSVLDMPVMLMIAFERRFGLCTSAGAVTGHGVVNGSSSYVNTLRDFLESGRSGDDLQNEVKIQLNAAVEAIRVIDDSMFGHRRVQLMTRKEGITNWEEFDEVIFTLKRHELRKIFQHPESSPCSSRYRGTSQSTCLRLYQNSFGVYMPGDLETEVGDEGEFLDTVLHNDTLSAETLWKDLSDAEGCFYIDTHNFFQYNTSTAQSLLEHSQKRVIYKSEQGSPLLRECIQSLPSQHMITLPTAVADDLLTQMGIQSGSIVERKSWYHVRHSVSFFQHGRSAHVIQGLGGVWFAGAEFVMNFHEEAFISGLVVAHRLGAGFPFKEYAGALSNFVKTRSWMFYGLNPFVPPTTKRQDQK